MNRLHKVLEKAAEEIENLYGKETELSNELREFMETADDLWEFAQFMPEYEKLKERDRAKPAEKRKLIEGGRPYIGECPSCGLAITTANFCGNCGQRLDWNEEGES